MRSLLLAVLFVCPLSFAQEWVKVGPAIGFTFAVDPGGSVVKYTLVGAHIVTDDIQYFEGWARAIRLPAGAPLVLGQGILVNDGPKWEPWPTPFMGTLDDRLLLIVDNDGGDIKWEIAFEVLTVPYWGS